MVGNVQHGGLQIGTQGVDDRSWAVQILIALNVLVRRRRSQQFQHYSGRRPCILYLTAPRPTLHTSDIEYEISSCLCDVHTALGKHRHGIILPYALAPLPEARMRKYV